MPLSPLDSRRQFYEKRGRPDPSARSRGNLANPKVATCCAALCLNFALPLTPSGNLPFLTGCIRRIHAAIFSFMAGVMPPMRMLGRSLL